MTNVIQNLVTKLNPIPVEYAYLTPDFENRGRHLLNQWVLQSALAGGMLTLALVPLPYIIYPQISDIIVPFYVGIVICYLTVALIFKWWQNKINIYFIVFSGWTIVCSLSFIAMRLTNDFSGVSGMLVLSIVGFAGLIPWPPQWMVAFYSFITATYITLGLSMRRGDNWVDYGLTAYMLVNMVFLFGAAYALLIRLRWADYLKGYLIEQTNDKLQQDLSLAQEIQKGILPAAYPNWPEFDVICYTVSARTVGGDFYTYYKLPTINDNTPQTTYGLAIGDVSGKGVAAALLMATSLVNFNNLIKDPFSPTQRLTALDKAIKPYAESSNYNCALCYVELALPVTHLVGPKIDQNNVTISVVNAGCIAPYIKHKDGEVEWLEVGGMPLGQGFGSELGYRELKTTLAKGDMLIMTSDGVKSAKVDLDLSLGKTTISSLSDSSNLIEANLTHIGTIDFVTRGEEEKFITLSDTSTFSTDYLNVIGEVDTLHWDIDLANDIPLNLDIEGGFGDVDLNLQDMALTNLAVNIGAGSVDISLPPQTFNTLVNGGAGNFNMDIPTNAEVKVDINGGVGSVNIDIENNAVVELNIDGGVGSFTVDVPDEAAVRVEAETGIGNIDVPNWFDQLDHNSNGSNESGVWQTPNYNEAEKQIFITFDGGVGNLDIL